LIDEEHSFTDAKVVRLKGRHTPRDC